jgi:hypothetical protein
MSSLPFASLQDHQPVPLRNIALGACLLVALALWYEFVGRTDRVTYLGVGAETKPGGFVDIDTDPNGRYTVARGPLLDQLKPGCRDDFTYRPDLVHRRNAPKTIRAVTLVGCGQP